MMAFKEESWRKKGNPGGKLKEGKLEKPTLKKYEASKLIVEELIRRADNGELERAPIQHLIQHLNKVMPAEVKTKHEREIKLIMGSIPRPGDDAIDITPEVKELGDEK